MPRMFIISGPSGAGKGSLVEKILEIRPNLHRPISHTTRPPREKEVNGLHYHFVTIEVFQEMITRKAFIEYAEYPPGSGKLYGTSQAELVTRLDCLIEVDTRGARSIKLKYPHAKIFFITTKEESLRRRLEARGGLTSEEIDRRVTRAKYELIEISQYCARVVYNDDGEENFANALRILRAHICAHTDTSS